MTEKLSVCFVWHMHQPLYKDRSTGLYLLPWVRLHAIKDYLDMPARLEEFPTLSQTFNLVPVLLEQLIDYGERDAVDEQLLLTCKKADEYTVAEKTIILSESFHANLARQIKPYRPFYELYRQRERLARQGHSFASMVGEFSDQQFADMTCWMNLCWFDPLWVSQDAELRQYFAQGASFTLQQRLRLIEKERELIRRIIPFYKRLQETGQIEITTGPYYHPILPLLFDSNVARYACPHAALPEQLYFHGADAVCQLESGMSLLERLLGAGRARGIWPPELAVSPAALELAASHGLAWAIADEALLSRTAGVNLSRDKNGNLKDPRVLCQPYRLDVGEQEIVVFFREGVLSHEIGFSCAGQEPEQAASAIYGRIKHIQEKLTGWEREGVVVIALDGENCWEAYAEDGGPFLGELYRLLAGDASLNVSTVSDYLDRQPAKESLHSIHCGSWIGADYHIWIGDPVKNRAWDLLSQTRKFLSEQLKSGSFTQDVEKDAWEEIYAAEGSDWFWWFGKPNTSAHDAIFDEQFRRCLKNVYRILGLPSPAVLDLPVCEQVHAPRGSQPGLPVKPAGR